jgi:hypothetical protein
MVPADALASLSAPLRLNEGAPICQFNRFNPLGMGQARIYGECA